MAQIPNQTGSFEFTVQLFSLFHPFFFRFLKVVIFVLPIANNNSYKQNHRSFVMFPVVSDGKGIFQNFPQQRVKNSWGTTIDAQTLFHAVPPASKPSDTNDNYQPRLDLISFEIWSFWMEMTRFLTSFVCL